MTILTAWTAFAGLGMVFMPSARGADNTGGKASDSGPTAEQAGAGITHGLTVNLFRLHAASDVDGAVKKWGDDAFQAKWTRDVREVFNEHETIALKDFFTSAVVWVGGMKGLHGIVALYSPWSDALLVLEQRVEAGPAPKAVLSGFRFISGESLRGVAAITPAGSFSLHPLREPLTVAVSRLYAPSVAAFTRLYPPAGAPELLPAVLRDRIDSPVGELILIKTRLVLRLKMFQDYLSDENKGWMIQSGVLIRALAAGDPAALRAFLSEKQSPSILETACALQPEIRKTFTPVYFSKAKDSVIMGLVNPAAPRWYIEAEFLGAEPAARIGRIQVMDVETSAKALALWGKEAPQ
ncbi:MAG: hypothetical protein RBT78_08220 [Kiritimatiellia bacterium]|jgi:hypothetical protein|nr:hypothetical protein [Kiritimatiellia bacterium]